MEALALTVNEVELSNKDIISSALNSYNNLSGAAQALLDAEKLLLDNLQSKINKLKQEALDLAAIEAANRFKSDHTAALALIVDTITVEDETAIDEALTAYGGLSGAAQVKITEEKSLLDTLKTKIGELKQAATDQASADAVIGSINELPAVDELILENKAAVEAARVAYDGLTAEQKALVTNLDVLEEVEEKMAELEADAAATEAVNEFKTNHLVALALKVDTVEIGNEGIIDVALIAYGGLSEAAQVKITEEKSLLDTLKIKIGKLKQAATDQAKADDVTLKIVGLPLAEDLTLEDKEAVEVARSRYDGLTIEQKALVSNLGLLEAVESRVLGLEKAALMELNNLVIEAEQRIRPSYTASIPEWNTYWNSFSASKNSAAQTLIELTGKESLSLDESGVLVTSLQNFKNSIEILDGIEDFDLSFGDRVSPKGLEIAINDQSKTTNGGNRLRVYYDEDSSDIYWILSEYLQGQKYYQGTSGTGIKTGLLNVMKTDVAYKLQSDDRTIQPGLFTNLN